jgi:general secretion pathway protein G
MDSTKRERLHHSSSIAIRALETVSAGRSNRPDASVEALYNGNGCTRCSSDPLIGALYNGSDRFRDAGASIDEGGDLAMLIGVRGRRGFTLLEVMVVIVILGILAALVVPKIISRPDEARVIAAKQDIASLMQALKLYRLDNQRYPTTEQGLQALQLKPTTAPIPLNWKAGGYVERLPKDPWGNIYQYLNPGVRGEIDVFSYGADGAPGGEGNDADIGSWNL